MAQLSLYMTDKEMDELRADANRHGQSISAFARGVLAHRDESEKKGWENGWPPGFFDLYGSSPAFPDIQDIPPEPIETW